MYGKVIDAYRNHLSVVAIKSSLTKNSKFNLRHAITLDIYKIINLFNSDKATGSDSILVKFIKLNKVKTRAFRIL